MAIKQNLNKKSKRGKKRGKKNRELKERDKWLLYQWGIQNLDRRSQHDKKSNRFKYYFWSLSFYIQFRYIHDKVSIVQLTCVINFKIRDSNVLRIIKKKVSILYIIPINLKLVFTISLKFIFFITTISMKKRHIMNIYS